MSEKTPPAVSTVIDFLNAAAPNEHSVAAELREVLAGRLEGRKAIAAEQLLTNLPLRLDLSGPSPTVVPLDRSDKTGLANVVAAVASIPQEQWRRLKICPASDCEWAFYDNSRNRSRRWCSMQTCGNRAKVNAFRCRSPE